MGAHERAHFAASRKKHWGPAAPLVPYHRASSIFFAALVGPVSGDVFSSNGREDAYKLVQRNAMPVDRFHPQSHRSCDMFLHTSIDLSECPRRDGHRERTHHRRLPRFDQPGSPLTIRVVTRRT
jgi:hypothetical protein